MRKKTIPKLVSIILPCGNTRELIRKCFSSLMRTQYPNFEVIIIDDFSTDGTYQVLQQLTAKNEHIKLFRNPSNLGPSATRNFGIKKSSGYYIAFVETDMEFEKDWLTHLVKVLDENQDVGAVQSKVMQLNNKSKIQAVGVKYDPHTFWVVSIGVDLPGDDIMESQEVGLGSVGTLFRKSLFKEIGGFDEKIVHNIDDIDLSWRLWLAGYKAISCPKSVTYHWAGKPHSVRARSTPSLKSEFYSQKTLRIFLKNYELVNILKYTPWLYFIMIIRVLKNLIHGNTNPLIGFIKAFFWNVLVLFDTLKERKRIQSMRKRSDDEIIKKIGIRGNFFQIYLKHILPITESSKIVFR